jgi:hypothetical protein
MNDNLKIITQKGKVTTLRGLFKGKEKTRKLMATLSFEEKIKMLVSLQELARGWGGRKDVLIWEI